MILLLIPSPAPSIAGEAMLPCPAECLEIIRRFVFSTARHTETRDQNYDRKKSAEISHNGLHLRKN